MTGVGELCLCLVQEKTNVAPLSEAPYITQPAGLSNEIVGSYWGKHQLHPRHDLSLGPMGMQDSRTDLQFSIKRTLLVL